MTLLYTSYYGRLREMEEKFKDRGVLKVAISRKIPKGVNVFLRLEDFVPSNELVHLAKDNIITNKEFHKMYYEQNLRNCDKDKFKKVIADLSDAFSVIVFLCYEKPDDGVCHRHDFAKWATEECGIRITEFTGERGVQLRLKSI